MVIDFNFRFQPMQGAACEEEPKKHYLLDWMAQEIYVAQKNLRGSSGSYINYLLQNFYRTLFDAIKNEGEEVSLSPQCWRESELKQVFYIRI